MNDLISRCHLKKMEHKRITPNIVVNTSTIGFHVIMKRQLHTKSYIQNTSAQIIPRK